MRARSAISTIVIVMDEATRKMIAEEFTIWGQFVIGCLIMWDWAVIITNLQRATFPRAARFFSWIVGITAFAVFVIYGLMNTLPFCDDCPNPLHLWMRIVLVLSYLGALGYIIKRRSEIQPPKLPTSK